MCVAVLPQLEVDEAGPQAAVSERVARAILLSGQPPLPPEPTRAEPPTPSGPDRQ